MLDSEPWLLAKIGVKYLLSVCSEVGVGWDQLLVSVVFPGECLGEYKDVVASKEGVWVESYRLDDDFRVFCCSLVARRTVKVPIGELLDTSYFLFEGPILGSESERAVDPNVSGDDLSMLVDVSEKVERRF